LTNRPQTTGMVYHDCKIEQFPADMYTKEEWSQLWDNTQKYLAENI
jgi:hypothetical protein